jgi:hypothetical protein
LVGRDRRRVILRLRVDGRGGVLFVGLAVEFDVFGPRFLVGVVGELVVIGGQRFDRGSLLLFVDLVELVLELAAGQLGHFFVGDLQGRGVGGTVPGFWYLTADFIVVSGWCKFAPTVKSWRI